MKLLGKMLLPVLVIFIATSCFIFLANPLWVKYHIDKNVLLGANLLFMLISVFAFFIQQNALKNPNPNVFIRSVIAGMMIKMFSTAFAVLAYVLTVGKGFDKKAVFLSLFLYLIYLAAEVMAISKVNRKRDA